MITLKVGKTFNNIQSAYDSIPNDLEDSYTIKNPMGYYEDDKKVAIFIRRTLLQKSQ